MFACLLESASTHTRHSCGRLCIRPLRTDITPIRPSKHDGDDAEVETVRETAGVVCEQSSNIGLGSFCVCSDQASSWAGGVLRCLARLGFFFLFPSFFSFFLPSFPLRRDAGMQTVHTWRPGTEDAQRVTRTVSFGAAVYHSDPRFANKHKTKKKKKIVQQTAQHETDGAERGCSRQRPESECVRTQCHGPDRRPNRKTEKKRKKRRALSLLAAAVGEGSGRASWGEPMRVERSCGRARDWRRLRFALLPPLARVGFSAFPCSSCWRTPRCTRSRRPISCLTAVSGAAARLRATRGRRWPSVVGCRTTVGVSSC